MKQIKMLGLTALAALTAMAFVGASSAMAESTALCDTDPGTGSYEVCPAGHSISHVHETTLSGAKAVLLTSPTVECDVLFLGDTVAGTSTPLEIQGNLTYTNCGSGCSVTETSARTTLKVLKLGHELGDVEGAGVVHVNCIGINCEYNGEGLIGHALGPLLSSETNGGVRIEDQTVHKLAGGFLCPKTAKLDLSTTPLIATQITGYGPTSLCSKDEGSPFCKSENQLKTIDYKDKAVELLTNLINVKCEGLASGAVGTPGNPLEISPELTYTGCSGGCFVTSVAGPGKIILQREGVAEEAKATSEGFEIFVKCGTTIKCLFGPEKMTGKALGALTTGDNGHLTFSKVSLGKGEGAICPKEATLDALYVASSAAYIG